MTTEDPVPATPSSDLRRRALLALVLIVVGVAVVTTGVGLAFGTPTAMIVLGVMLLGAGVVLGLMS